MELRRVFDTIPEKFDRWRPRYCPQAFRDIIAFAGLGAGRSALEIGPGTGQATEPVLRSGCDYLAVELGENLAAFMRGKFGAYPNFDLVNDDFITHDFGLRRFDLVYSAATIQWIPEETAFPKVFHLLKSGGTLAMMLMRGDYREPNEALFTQIQKVYSQYFHPEPPYTQQFNYSAAPDYGFVDFERREYPSQRVFTADEYVEFCGTHCDHIVLREPERSNFFDGLRRAVLDAGDRIVFKDTIVLYLARKP